LSGYLREKSAEIEEARRLPGEVVTRLRDAGMFRLMMRKNGRSGNASGRTGRSHRGTRESQCFRRLVRHDRMRFPDFSAGFLEDGAAREIYPRLDMATAGSATPSGARSMLRADIESPGNGRSVPG